MIIKKIRSSVFTKSICLLLSFSFVLIGCTHTSNIEPIKAISGNSGEDLFKGIFFLEGEVTKKLPFFDAFNYSIQKQAEINPDLLIEKSKMVNELVLVVKSLDPNFFNELKDDIESQNFNRIQATLEKGAALSQSAILLNEALKEDYVKGQEVISKLNLDEYNFSEEKDIQRFLDDSESLFSNLHQSDKSPQNGSRQMCLAVWAVVAAVVWEVAVAINVVAAINIGVAVFAVTKVVDSSPRRRMAANEKPYSSSDLGKEILIKQIAFNLK